MICWSHKNVFVSRNLTNDILTSKKKYEKKDKCLVFITGIILLDCEIKVILYEIKVF